jgi:hypothetical protein
MPTETKEPTVEPEVVHTKADLSKVAHDYHIPISDGTFDSIAEGGVDGAKLSAFEDYAKTTAKGLYPTIAKQIDGGIKPAYLLDPYRQVAKMKLGEDVEPDFVTDPKWSAALSGGTDIETGHPAPMTLDAWKAHLQTEPGFGWDKNPKAIANAHETMQKIGAGLGVEG